MQVSLRSAAVTVRLLKPRWRRADLSLCVDEEPVHQFQREEPVNLCGVVAVAFKMAPHNRFHTLSVYIRAREGSGIEQNLLDIFCKNGAIPPAEMEEFVATHPETLQV